MRRICEGLLGPCSGISAWMCSWGRWDAEIPVLWDAPHVLRRPRGDSLRLAAVCREVINQDCCRHPLGSGSQIGWSFPRLLPLIFPLEWGEKKPFSLIIHSSWCTAFFSSQKYFPALPHTLQPYSPTASARVVVRCSLSSLEAWGIGSRANDHGGNCFPFLTSLFSHTRLRQLGAFAEDICLYEILQHTPVSWQAWVRRCHVVLDLLSHQRCTLSSPWGQAVNSLMLEHARDLGPDFVFLFFILLMLI